MSHEHKLIGSRLVTRNQILSPQGGTNRILEKSPGFPIGKC